MIARYWCGLANHEDADRYLDHLRSATLPRLKAIPGFVDMSVLKRRVTLGVEFLVVTSWESMDAIRRFAGTDPDRAVVPPDVQEMMVAYDRDVRHYEVLE